MPTPHPMQQQADQAKASMGIATFLQSHLLPQQGQQPQQGQPGQGAPQNAPGTQETAPQPPTDQQTPTDVGSQISGLEERIMGEIGTLKQEMEKVTSGKDLTKDLQDLKTQIETIINSNDQTG